MSTILESNKIKMISTNGSYSCAFDMETEECNVYRNTENDLIFLKALQVLAPVIFNPLVPV